MGEWVCYSIKEYALMQKDTLEVLFLSASKYREAYIMKLSSLLEKLEYTCVQGSTEQEVTGVVYDSRKVTEGSLFICIRGAVVDGHKFIPDVVKKGATVLVVEEKVTVPSDVTVIQVEDTRYAMAFISAAWFGHPAEKLKTIGITGTNARPSIAPTFGVENMMGTNPLTFALPTDEEFPFCLDCATSIVQRGKIEYYAREGKDTPAGMVVSENGEAMTNS